MNLEELALGRRPRGASAALFAALALLAGCSSSSGAGGSDGGAGVAESGASEDGGGGTDASTGDASGPVSGEAGASEGGGAADAGNADRACADYVAAFCGRYKACSNYWFLRQYGDDATCQARNLIGCAGQFAARGTTWTPAGLEACVAAIPTASCQELIMLNRLPAACTPAPGTLAMGESCAVDAQCQGQVCLFGGFGSCGTCQTVSPVNSICVDSSECAAGTVCAGSSSPGSCTTYAAEGGSCNGVPCAPWLLCQNGVCGKPEGVGGTCSSDPNALDPCDNFGGILCDSTMMKCVAPVPDPTNQSCAGGSICSASYSCATDGSCIPPIKEGDDCAVLSGPSCLAPSRCDNGICTLPDPARCSATSQDAGHD
jgi:hypothetical protein